MSVCYDTAQALVFLLVSMWVSLGVLAAVKCVMTTAQAWVFLLVSVCYDTAQALVFLLVSMWVSLGVLAAVNVL